jgi:hypothetical protein
MTIPGALEILNGMLEGIVTGAFPGSRASMPAVDAGLPEGRDVYYQRYDVSALPARVPSVLNGPRIFWQSGSRNIYFAPYHGRPGLGVPSGYILFYSTGPR